MLSKLFKIEFLEKEYIIKEEEKIVICKLKWRLRGYHFSLDLDPTRILGTYIKTEIGVARCHPDDTFDIKKGRYIAESKAKKSVYKKAFKCIEYLKKTVLDLLIGVTLFSYDFYKKLYDKEIKHIEDVSKPD